MEDQDTDSPVGELDLENLTILGLLEQLGKYCLLFLVKGASVFAAIGEQLTTLFVIYLLHQIVPLPTLLIRTGNRTYPIGTKYVAIAVISAIAFARLIRINTTSWPEVVKVNSNFGQLSTGRQEDNEAEDSDERS